MRRSNWSQWTPRRALQYCASTSCTARTFASWLALSTTVHGLVRIVRARRRHGGNGRRALLKCGCRSLRRGLFSLLFGRRRLLPMDGFHRQRPREGDVGILHDRPDLDLFGHRKRRGWRLRDGLLALDTVGNARRYWRNSLRSGDTLSIARPRQKNHAAGKAGCQRRGSRQVAQHRDRNVHEKAIAKARAGSGERR